MRTRDSAKKRVAIAAVALLASLGTLGQTSKPDARPAIFGRWEVVQVICPTCGFGVNSDTGSVIVFEAASITNPFGGDCAQSPGYNRLRKVSPQSLLETKGKSWPKELIRQLKGNDSLLYGYVTCEGMNHMRMIFAGGVRAYYFWEGDRVFVLARRKS